MHHVITLAEFQWEVKFKVDNKIRDISKWGIPSVEIHCWKDLCLVLQDWCLVIRVKTWCSLPGDWHAYVLLFLNGFLVFNIFPLSFVDFPVLMYCLHERDQTEGDQVYKQCKWILVAVKRMVVSLLVVWEIIPVSGRDKGSIYYFWIEINEML